MRIFRYNLYIVVVCFIHEGFFLEWKVPAEYNDVINAAHVSETEIKVKRVLKVTKHEVDWGGGCLDNVVK